MVKLNSYMVQYGVWPNCCNNCDFCLRRARVPITKQQQIDVLRFISENIKHIDWTGKFSAGISLLGGELYYIQDKELLKEFLKLIDSIVENVLIVSKNPVCRYSTVTNGIYDPTFLYEVVDRIVDSVGIQKVDINFSYDLKYRYLNEQDRIKVLENINAFHKRYNYRVGILMILTLHVIDLWKSKLFNTKKFIAENAPGNNLCFLYPHNILTGKKLDDFFFKRKDLLMFLDNLKQEDLNAYKSFMLSTKHSALFKYTGYKFRDNPDIALLPVLCDDKEIINPDCGHSILYKCYSDTDKCMMCDLENFDEMLLM